jgi:hypothetical protein
MAPARGPDADDRTLCIVEDRAAVGPPLPGTEYLVLDMTWTPLADEREDIVPVRPLIVEILRTRNLFEASLDGLDAYAASADLVGRFSSSGVTWWYHARSVLALGVQERLLWCYLLAELVRTRSRTRILVRVDRPALADAARALISWTAPLQILIDPPRPVPPTARPAAPAASAAAPAVRAPGGPATAAGAPPPPTLVARIRRPLGRIRRYLLRTWRAWRGVPAPSPPAKPPGPEERAAALADRVAGIAARPERSVLSVVMAASFHTVQGDGEEQRVDPYVSPILDRLAGRGVQTPIVVLGLDHRRLADWRRIEADRRIIPASYLALLPTEEADETDDDEPPDDGGSMSDIPELRLSAEGFDLGPAIQAMVAGLGGWFAQQAGTMAAAETLLSTLRPTALFTGWEAARTAWLGAARRLGIPSVAVQHGVVYARSPDYVRTPHETLVRPDLTCVFGPYERDLLVAEGRYAPETVVVTGSPRIDPDGARRPTTPDERARVRAELGIAPGERLLVVSAGRRFIGDTIHGLAMASRMLGGPLPGVHIVVKLHPEARDDDGYGELLRGLAAAGGYQPAPLTVVRDTDVYRLLRSSDAHLGIYSTVLTDAVLTGTPNMIAVGQALEDLIGYVDAGVAVPVRRVEDVRAFMRDPEPAAPDARARFVAAHYAEGDAVERIASAILEVGA